MRIGQLTYSYQPILGGGDVYADLLRQIFTAQGYDQHIYQRITSAQDPVLRFIPNPLARLGKGEFWTQGLFLKRLRNDLCQEDVLIAHYPNYLLAAKRLCNNGKPRIIGLSHGVTWDDRPGSCRSHLKRALARRAFRTADAFVANDTYFLREMGLAAPPRTGLFTEIAPRRWFIPNSIPPGYQPGTSRADLQDLKPILLPRNLYRNRGIHLAVEAFAIFATHHPETHLLIAGEVGQPAYADYVKKRVADLKLQERVIFRGHVSHEQMPDYYASSEMCLIPSLCGEGTSLSALEAMACRCATISTNVAGLLDLPTVQCAPSPETLAQAMQSVYANKDDIAAQQHDQVTRDYAYERWAATWLQVVKQVAEIK
jgi:glycosyltransferase involved in cell wall biosynthesis